jgi:hypothetical protein
MKTRICAFCKNKISEFHAIYGKGGAGFDICTPCLNKEIARKKLHELNAEIIREEINNG